MVDVRLAGRRRAIADRDGLAWQQIYTPDLAYRDPSPHMLEVLDWGAGLQADMRPDPAGVAAVVFRGGAKSATAETVAAMTVAKRTRRYVLYVSRTQELADDHVANIGAILAGDEIRHDYPQLGRVRVDRAGSRDVWRHNRIRVGGCTVDAIGLNVNVRGARVGRFRPDLIVFDDVDSRHDTPRVAQGVVETITESILGAGSETLAVLVAQNMPNGHGFVARLVDGTAGYLAGCRVIGPVPAVEGLQYRSEPDPQQPDVNRWKIVAGTPSWPDGYPLERAEADLNLEGPAAFEAERQHNRHAAGGHFDPDAWQWLDPAEVPDGVAWCRGWDFAASDDTTNDRTACVLVGRAPDGRWIVGHCDAGWWAAHRVETELVARTEQDGRGVQVDIPQDPAQAGKEQAARRAALLSGFRVAVTPQNRAAGSKLTRASGVIAQQQAGNVWLVRGPAGGRMVELVAECDGFRGGDQATHDDLVDALSAGFNRLVRRPAGGVGGSTAQSAVTVRA